MCACNSREVRFWDQTTTDGIKLVLFFGLKEGRLFVEMPLEVTAKDVCLAFIGQRVSYATLILAVCPSGPDMARARTLVLGALLNVHAIVIWRPTIRTQDFIVKYLTCKPK